VAKQKFTTNMFSDLILQERQTMQNKSCQAERNTFEPLNSDTRARFVNEKNAEHSNDNINVFVNKKAGMFHGLNAYVFVFGNEKCVSRSFQANQPESVCFKTE